MEKIELFSVDTDKVIDALFISGKTSYAFALFKLVPLIDKLAIQRNLQDAKFYRRLEKDLIKGCVMPPITLAFIEEEHPESDLEHLVSFINENIESAFVLDGIQRLNTLKRTFSNFKELDLSRPIFVNIIICKSMDNLLYRMITLNNGQKPMSARHQIEMLAENILEFENLSIRVTTEKGRERAIRGAFQKADVIRAYIAFLGNNVNIESRKIIEEKMDELIADRILESDITEDNYEFQDVIELVNKLCEQPENLEWFKVNNNLIGFVVGAKRAHGYLETITSEQFSAAIRIFEEAFSGFQVSKIRVGEERRRQVAYYTENLKALKEFSPNNLLAQMDQN